MSCSDRQPRDEQDGGMSLLEVLVVLAIIAAAYAVAAPNLRSPTERVQAETVARDLASHLRGVRATAIGRGAQLSIRFDIEKRQYRADGDQPAVSWPAQIGVSLTTARVDTRNDGTPVIRFFADGSSTGGTIDLKSDTRTDRIVVDWLTGTVRIETVR